MSKLSPLFNGTQLISGLPATGGKLFTYVAGSSTKQTTYKGEGGTTPHANPIILNSRGEVDNPIWLTEGVSYKFVFTGSDDTDPPASPIRTVDNVSGINDASVSLSQWVDSGLSPTYINGTSFTVPGDQTSAFQVNRRVKISVTAGTIYGYVSSAAYNGSSLTTITVVNDSGSLDSGISNVQYGLLTPENPSFVAYDKADTNGNVSNEFAVASDPYSGDWDGNTGAARKDDVYDKIEAVDASIPAAYSDTRTWQDMSGSRTHTTSYQNTTGNTIQVALDLSTTLRNIQISSDDSTWLTLARSNSTVISAHYFDVPNNWYYRLSGSITIFQWHELR